MKVKPNAQAKVLSCMFYIANARAGQTVHAIWNATTVAFFAYDGEHLSTYPRPAATSWHFGPRTPNGTPMKGASQTPATATEGSARRKVSKGGYVGALANKYYAGYKRAGQDVDVTWTATTVTITDTSGATISEFTKPTHKHGWHGPGWTTSTKS